ncbi:MULTISPECIES: hypothetical protein [Cupriavidus]
MSPIEVTNDGARLRLYPNTDLLVDVPRAVALHLFALVCRYNVAKGRNWDRFWRALRQVERDMTVLFVQANGVWGQPLPPERMFGITWWLSGLAEDFRAAAASGRRIPLGDDVQQELYTLFGLYVRAMVSPERLQRAWADEYPEIVALLDQAGVLASLLQDGRGFDAAQVCERVQAVLLARGAHVVQPIAGFTHEERCRNDARLFAGVPSRLAMADL